MLTVGTLFPIAVSIPEDSDVEGTVTILETSDQDRDKNGKFECSMEDMDLQTMDTFSVRRIPEGCALVLRSFLDWSTANQYSFTVRATDQADAAQRKSAVATGKEAFSFSSSVINTCCVLVLLSNFKSDAVNKSAPQKRGLEITNVTHNELLFSLWYITYMYPMSQNQLSLFPNLIQSYLVDTDTEGS